VGDESIIAFVLAVAVHALEAGGREVEIEGGRVKSLLQKVRQ